MPSLQQKINSLAITPVPNLLAGLVMALVLIPEAIGFAGVAGFPPEIGLYGAIFLTITIAFTGSRVAMITSASGSTAVLMTGLAAQGSSFSDNKGIILLLTASMLAGLFQIIWSLLNISALMKYIPKAVVSGFVNALALLILQAELPQLGFEQLLGLEKHQETFLPTANELPTVWVLTTIGLLIIYSFPYITKKIPSQLISIAAVTVLAWTMKLDVPRVSDLGTLPQGIHLPAIPFLINGSNNIAGLDLLWTTVPIAIAISLVGLLETFLTVDYIDTLTETTADKKSEGIGQGIANIITSLFGGMAGCALVGESVMNVKNGAKSRLSTLSTGLFILAILIFARSILGIIPLAAVAAVMISIAVATADSDSLRMIGRLPKIDTLLMIATFLATMLTHPHNLAVGVIVGVSTSQFYGYIRRKANHRSDQSD